MESLVGPRSYLDIMEKIFLATARNEPGFLGTPAPDIVLYRLSYDSLMTEEDKVSENMNSCPECMRRVSRNDVINFSPVDTV
jgi:hypothetical protein